MAEWRKPHKILNNEIEIVNNFNCLGLVLSSGGSYVKATNTFAGKSLKAINS